MIESGLFAAEIMSSLDVIGSFFRLSGFRRYVSRDSTHWGEGFFRAGAESRNSLSVYYRLKFELNVQ
jgi:hypothetical protein